MSSSCFPYSFISSRFIHLFYWNGVCGWLVGATMANSGRPSQVRIRSEPIPNQFRQKFIWSSFHSSRAESWESKRFPIRSRKYTTLSYPDWIWVTFPSKGPEPVGKNPYPWNAEPYKTLGISATAYYYWLHNVPLLFSVHFYDISLLGSSCITFCRSAKWVCGKNIWVIESTTIITISLYAFQIY